MVERDSLHSSNLSLPYKYLGDSGIVKHMKAVRKFKITPNASI